MVDRAEQALLTSWQLAPFNFAEAADRVGLVSFMEDFYGPVAAISAVCRSRKRTGRSDARSVRSRLSERAARRPLSFCSSEPKQEATPKRQRRPLPANSDVGIGMCLSGRAHRPFVAVDQMLAELGRAAKFPAKMLVVVVPREMHPMNRLHDCRDKTQAPVS